MPIGLPLTAPDQPRCVGLLSVAGNPPYVEIAITPTAVPVAGEAHTVPSSPFQVVIAPPAGGVFSADEGVRYANGTPLTPISSGTPTTGKYICNIQTGTYTFAAGDVGSGILISYTYANGNFNVQWSINTGTYITAPVQLAGGSLMMKSTDLYAKLLYQIKAGWLQVMAGFTLGQFVPPPSSLTPNASGIPAAGASFYSTFSVNLVAGLPENPAQLGL